MDILGLLGVILGSGGIGALITQLLHLKANKKIKNAKAEKTINEVNNDNFDALYKKINTLINDYNKLDDEYRSYREAATLRERNFSAKVAQNCEVLAELRSQVQYLKGLRCYNTTCPNRIKNNPEKLK